MSRVAQRMEDLIVEHFAPSAFSIMDDSRMHAGHAGAREGGESHFTVKIVSDKFAGKSKVERHRMVYSLFQPLFDEGLHALVIQALTPGEAD